ARHVRRAGVPSWPPSAATPGTRARANGASRSGVHPTRVRSTRSAPPRHTADTAPRSQQTDTAVGTHSSPILVFFRHPHIRGALEADHDRLSHDGMAATTNGYSLKNLPAAEILTDLLHTVLCVVNTPTGTLRVEFIRFTRERPGF